MLQVLNTRTIPFLLCTAWLLAGFYCIAINLDAATLHGGLVLALGWFVGGLLLMRRAPLPTSCALALIAGGLYLAWGWFAQVTPTSEFERLLKAAQDVAQGVDGGWQRLLESRSPVVVAWHLIFQWLLGTSLVASYLASAVLWGVQAPLLIGALTNFGVPRRVALLATALYLLGPGIVAFAPVVSSESMTQALLVLALFQLSRPEGAGLGRVALIGVLAALLVQTRSSNLVFVPALGLYAILQLRDTQGMVRPLRTAGLFAAGLLACMLLYGTARKVSGGDFAMTSIQWRTLPLLHGVNRATNGGYSALDVEAAGYTGRNRLPLEQANARAWELAWENINADRLDFISFALTNKLNRVWGDDSQSLLWSTLRSPVRPAWDERGLTRVLTNVINSFWAFLVGTAALGSVLLLAHLRGMERRDWAALALLAALPCLLTALLHVLLDVQSRYHMVFTPYLALAAAWGLHALVHRPRPALPREAPARRPLPAANTASTGQPPANRRRQRRVPIVVSAEIKTEDGRTLTGNTRDLSIRSVYIEQTPPLEIATEGTVGILLETGGRPIRLMLKGKVVRTDDQGMAMEFTAMTRECYENLQFVVAHNAAAQAGR